MERNGFAKDAVPIAIILIFSMLFFHRPLFFNEPILEKNFMNLWSPWRYYSNSNETAAQSHDTERILYPAKALFEKEIRQGRLMLWDPYVLSGRPLLADPAGAASFLTPFNVFYFFLPFTLAFNLQFLIPILLLAVSSYFLLKDFGLRRTAALIGSISIGFGTSTIINIGHPLLPVMSWLPMIILMIKKFFETGRFSYFFLACIFNGMQFLGGHLQWSFYSVVATAASAFYFFFSSEAGRSIKKLALSLISLIAGMLIGAAQLLPSYELLSNSSRSLAYVIWYPPWHLLMLLAPSILGDVIHGYYANVAGTGSLISLFGLVKNAAVSHLDTVYVGILALALAILSFSSRKKGWWLFFTLFIMGVALSALAPLYTLGPLAKLPVISQIGAFGRASFLMVFALGGMAALGADSLFSFDKRYAKKFVKVCVFILIFAGLLAIAGSVAFANKDKLVSTASNYGQAFYGSSSQAYAAIFVEKLHSIWNIVIFKALVLAALFLLIAVFLAVFYSKQYFGKAIFIAVIILLASTDLFYNGSIYFKTSPPKELYFKTPELELIQSDKTSFRIASLAEVDANGYTIDLPTVPNTLSLYSIQEVNGASSAIPRRYTEFMRFVGIGQRNNMITVNNSAGRLFDMLNAKYVLSFKSLNDSKLQLLKAGNVSTYRNLKALPRVFLAGNYTIIQDKAERLKYLSSPSFEPLNAVVLEQNLGIQINQSNGTAEIVSYLPEKVSVRTNSSTNQILVLLDSYFPGWTANVDGFETKIIPAYHTFRAVAVPAGKHMIVFEYRPSSFKIGTMISVAALILCIIGAVFSKIL